MTRLLLTGAQGFLGRHAAGAWLAADAANTVFGLGRSPRIAGFTHTVTRGERTVEAPLPDALAEILASGRFHYEAIDLLDRPALVRALQQARPDVILHAAGAVRSATHAEHANSHLVGTTNLFEAIVGAGIPRPRVVLVSSGAIYGDHPMPRREDDPPSPLDIYAVCKLAAEHSADLLGRRHGLQVVVARVFNVTGPGADERHAAGRFASRLAAIRDGLLGPTLETGPLDAVRDYIDVRDAAAQLVALARVKDPPPIVNIASGAGVSLAHVVERLLDVSDPEGAVSVLRRRGDPGAAANIADVRKARAIGLPRPRPLSEALADLLAWHRHEVAAAASEARAPRSVVTTRVRGESCWAYDVEVAPGISDTLVERIRAGFPSAHVAVLTDSNVRPLVAQAVHDALGRAGVRTSLHTLPAGETHKSPAAAESLISALHDAGVDRRSLLLCVGGGVVCDTGGFVAATYLRGVDYALVPTTLLAQHDAAVGGKVAVNTPWAKNFVGAFHHPRAVWVDPNLLSTLEARDISSGIAEAIKVGLCGEPTLLHLLEEGAEAVMNDRDPALLAAIVSRAVRHKAALLEPDPLEADLRRVLNLGHTFGHPLETELAYEGLRHGEAVGMGLAVAIEIARQRALCDQATCDRLLRLLAAYKLPPRVPRDRLHAALERLSAVRLVRGGALNFVAPTGWGPVTILSELGLTDFQRALQALERHPATATAVAA